jgi:hypothetical protein
VRIFAALATFVSRPAASRAAFPKSFQSIGAQDHDLFRSRAQFALKINARLYRKDISLGQYRLGMRRDITRLMYVDAKTVARAVQDNCSVACLRDHIAAPPARRRYDGRHAPDGLIPEQQLNR